MTTPPKQIKITTAKARIARPFDIISPMKDSKHLDRLNQTALDIEFLLISVIQGVALATLAASALSPLTRLEIQTWPYIIAAFLFILIFWSGAILHAVSFIDWPIDLTHSFLYFLASMVEIMAIASLASPSLWFTFLFIFQIIALMLYYYDLRLIKQHENKFTNNKAGRKLFTHIITEQSRELFIFIPASLLYNAIAITALFLQPIAFIQNNYHLIFIMPQLLFALLFLAKEIKSFKTRSHLLLRTNTDKFS